MATSREIELLDLFPTASVSTTLNSESITIPLADLTTEGGLDANELASDDARKIFFAILRTGAKKLEDISETYNTRVNNLQTWAAGTDFQAGDEVEQSGIIYQATVDHTAGNTFNADLTHSTPKWAEQSVQAPPLNFTSSIGTAVYGSGDFGAAEVSQTMTFSATYQGTTDLKPE